MTYLINSKNLQKMKHFNMIGYFLSEMISELNFSEIKLWLLCHRREALWAMVSAGNQAVKLKFWKVPFLHHPAILKLEFFVHKDTQKPIRKYPSGRFSKGRSPKFSKWHEHSESRHCFCRSYVEKFVKFKLNLKHDRERYRVLKLSSMVIIYSY